MAQEIDYYAWKRQLEEVEDHLFDLLALSPKLEKSSAVVDIPGMAKIARGGTLINKTAREMLDLVHEKLPIIKRKYEAQRQKKRRIRQKGFKATFFFYDAEGKRTGSEEMYYKDWEQAAAMERMNEEMAEFNKGEAGHSFYSSRAPKGSVRMKVGKVEPWEESDKEYKERMSRPSDF